VVGVEGFDQSLAAAMYLLDDGRVLLERTSSTSCCCSGLIPADLAGKPRDDRGARDQHRVRLPPQHSHSAPHAQVPADATARVASIARAAALPPMAAEAAGASVSLVDAQAVERQDELSHDRGTTSTSGCRSEMEGELNFQRTRQRRERGDARRHGHHRAQQQSDNDIIEAL